jgi:hypothetical protein
MRAALLGDEEPGDLTPHPRGDQNRAGLGRRPPPRRDVGDIAVNPAGPSTTGQGIVSAQSSHRKERLWATIPLGRWPMSHSGHKCPKTRGGLSASSRLLRMGKIMPSTDAPRIRLSGRQRRKSVVLANGGRPHRSVEFHATRPVQGVIRSCECVPARR